MYALLEEDDPQNNPLIDWDFLNRCCVGFDREHMPTGANPDDNFKDYLLGTFTHEPKNPEWASEICGVAPDTIRGWQDKSVALAALPCSLGGLLPVFTMAKDGFMHFLRLVL